ncbi:MAG: type I methionyl aminopeptidase [Candidatus Acidiferrales bacterium]
MSITSEEELRELKEVGRIVGRALKEIAAEVKPGVTTGQLDELAAKILKRNGARSAPILVYGFPGSICISLNDEIVHGIPGPRVIRAGDLVKLDLTAEKGGFMADAAVTVPVPPVSDDARRLAKCAERAFRKAIGVARARRPLSDIGRAVEDEVHRSGFSVVRELCGHGIGRTIHEAPTVPNFYDPLIVGRLTEGLVITIEPLIAAGSGDEFLAKDGWTVKTRDRSLAAHFEHTLVITRDEPILLTAA